jgi:hypothetical protein
MDKQQLRNTMRARLLEKGLTVETWARALGFSEGVASKVVSRYIGKEKRPIGPTATRVIEGLERESGMRLCG